MRVVRNKGIFLMNSTLTPTPPAGEGDNGIRAITLPPTRTLYALWEPERTFWDRSREGVNNDCG